jgi:hypothetical protein
MTPTLGECEGARGMSGVLRLFSLAMKAYLGEGRTMPNLGWTDLRLRLGGGTSGGGMMAEMAGSGSCFFFLVLEGAAGAVFF